MNIEQERAEFAAWYEQEYSEPVPCGFSPHGHYLDARVQLLFRCWQARAALQSQDREDAQPKLQVIVRNFPESNGKRNWTALLRREQPWGGLVGNCGGITLARGELWNRVAYEAERTKFLLGMRDTEPFILDYSNDVETPEQWTGEAIDHARRVEGGK